MSIQRAHSSLGHLGSSTNFSDRAATRWHGTALVAALALVLGWAALSAATASAAVSYGAEQALSPDGQNAQGPEVAIDSSDRATAVWYRSDGSDHRIQSRRLGADGTLEVVQTLSAGGDDAEDPLVVVDSADRATVVWSRGDSEARIQAVRLAADGTPGTVHTLSTAGAAGTDHEIAIDTSDRVTVVWVRDDVVQSVRLKADGTPEVVQDLTSGAVNPDDPDVAIDSSDRATVVWKQFDGVSTDRIESIRIAEDGTPGTVQTLSASGQDAAFPQVAVDSADRATVVWTRSDGANERVRSIRIAEAGTPGAVQALSAAGADAERPGLAVDSADRAMILWLRVVGDPDDDIFDVRSVRLAADGSPGSIQTLLSAAKLPSAELAIDSADRATVVWRRDSGPPRRVEAHRLAANRTPDFAQEIPAKRPASSPAIAIDSDGRPTVVWLDDSGASDVVTTARGEFAPPQTSIGSGPASGSTTADATLSFGFSADVANPSFECQTDGAVFEACSSLSQLGALADGTHTFRVSATDETDGQVDASPAVRTFTVDTVLSGLTSSAKKKQRSAGKVKVKVRADEAVTVEATGTIRVPKVKGGASATQAKTKKFTLKPASSSLVAGEPRTLKLKLTKKAKKLTKKAQGKGKKAKAKVTITATDLVGNQGTAGLSVSLKR